MPQWTAFLRAINVGGHTVKMDFLRGLFESLGFSKVETFIASGNVFFESSFEDAQTLEKKIESCLQNSFGYEVSTFIRSAPELSAIANYRPFAPSDLEAEGNSLYIAFLKAPLTNELQDKVLAFRTAVDDFHVHGREIYWLSRKKMSESAFSGALLEKTIKMPATIRNSTTVQKLAVKINTLKQQGTE